MKKKVIKLNEKDIESLVEKILKSESVNESLPKREFDRQKTNFRKKSFEPYNRENELMDIFGPYKDDVPVNVISYMRKNPALIMSRLLQIYGKEKMLKYLNVD